MPNYNKKFYYYYYNFFYIHSDRNKHFKINYLNSEINVYHTHDYNAVCTYFFYVLLCLSYLAQNVKESN